MTPHQRDDAGGGVPEHPFQLGTRFKAGETVKLVEGLVGFHTPILPPSARIFKVPLPPANR